MEKVFLLFVIVFAINISICFASTNVTYFYGEPIVINDSNIDILSNEITIDVINSKIKNIFYLKNTSENTISTFFCIPIESREYSITAKNIEIKLNDTNVKRIDSIGEFRNRPIFIMKSKIKRI